VQGCAFDTLNFSRFLDERCISITDVGPESCSTGLTGSRSGNGKRPEPSCAWPTGGARRRQR
jgi:hypothetical protein